MRNPRHIRVTRLFISFFFCFLGGCSGLSTGLKAEIPLAERPRLALLPWGFEVQITNLDSVKTVDKELTLTPEQEKQQVTQVLNEILDEARSLLRSHLAAGQQFTLVPLEEIDVASADLGIKAGQFPTPDQLCTLRTRLRADLVLVGNILDYGKVRWQWLAAGELADVTGESLLIGLATSWNAPIILGNVGFELLTSTPIWFGGGYLFGIAFRPVRVEAKILDAVSGEPIWQDQEAAVFNRERLRQLPENERAKKEVQLNVNLTKAMEEIADSLIHRNFTSSRPHERRYDIEETACH